MVPMVGNFAVNSLAVIECLPWLGGGGWVNREGSLSMRYGSVRKTVLVLVLMLQVKGKR